MYKFYGTVLPFHIKHMVIKFEKFPPPWQTFMRGSGKLTLIDETLRFSNVNARSTCYSNAQLDDYQSLPRHQFLWKPPLQMTVRARFSGTLNGTAGFGFWNDPFMMTGWRQPTLPRAIWFFYSSPPSNMKLALSAPGYGWKAATIDAIRWPFFALLPLAPLAVPIMNIRPLYRLVWPIGQRAIYVSENLVSDKMTDWHTYIIQWQEKTARFVVDGRTVLDCSTSPRGPLGFVMWLDNQYMVVTPQGNFQHGLLDMSGEQWLEISQLEIRNEE